MAKHKNIIYTDYYKNMLTLMAYFLPFYSAHCL